MNSTAIELIELGANHSFMTDIIIIDLTFVAASD